MLNKESIDMGQKNDNFLNLPMVPRDKHNLFFWFYVIASSEQILNTIVEWTPLSGYNIRIDK